MLGSHKVADTQNGRTNAVNKVTCLYLEEALLDNFFLIIKVIKLNM